MVFDLSGSDSKCYLEREEENKLKASGTNLCTLPHLNERIEGVNILLLEVLLDFEAVFV